MPTKKQTLIDSILELSQNKKQLVRLYTSTSKETYIDGIVLQHTLDIIVIQNEVDFIFQGIIVLPRKKITGYRHSDIEQHGQKVLQYNKQLTTRKIYPWIKTLHTWSDVIKTLKRKQIWPMIEMASNKERGTYFGPITDLLERTYSIHFCDVCGIWQDTYTLPYTGIGEIRWGNLYTENFQSYMERT